MTILMEMERNLESFGLGLRSLVMYDVCASKDVVVRLQGRVGWATVPAHACTQYLEWWFLPITRAEFWTIA